MTHNFAVSGGAGSMTTFLHDVLQEEDGYCPEVISLASSSHDDASVRIAAPKTWWGEPKIIKRSSRGIKHWHIGAWFCEVEPFRYRPRTILNEVLSEFDVIQFVTGNPAWAYVSRDVDCPSFLWTATTLWEDRERRLKEGRPLRSLWRRAMTLRAQTYEKKALREVTNVFALSEYTHQNLKRRFNVDSKIATQGIDISRFQPAENPEEGYILSVSRINDPRKRVPLLLQAYAAAKSKHQDIPELYLVGEEPNNRIKETVSDLEITEDVQFLGRQSRTELRKLYQNAFCFVLSSDEEGLGIVILEAMACGLPVVSTRSGGPQTLIVDGTTGFLTPVGRADLLQEKILELAKNTSLRHKMRRASRRRMVDKFSMEEAGKPFLKAYSSI